MTRLSPNADSSAACNSLSPRFGSASNSEIIRLKSSTSPSISEMLLPTTGMSISRKLKLPINSIMPPA